MTRCSTVVRSTSPGSTPSERSANGRSTPLPLRSGAIGSGSTCTSTWMDASRCRRTLPARRDPPVPHLRWAPHARCSSTTASRCGGAIPAHRPRPHPACRGSTATAAVVCRVVLPRLLEVHHIIHWEHDGVTETWNLIRLCPHHHRMHHQGKLGISGNADIPGGVIFTDGNGNRSWPAGPDPRPPGHHHHRRSDGINTLSANASIDDGVLQPTGSVESDVGQSTPQRPAMPRPTSS